MSMPRVLDVEVIDEARGLTEALPHLQSSRGSVRRTPRL